MSIYSDKLAHIQVIINCQYSVAQMCTREDTLARYLGAPSLDDVMSHNDLTTNINIIIEILFRSTRHRELLSWMVDQMRLDHVPPTSSTLGTAGTNSESGSLDREPSPSVRVAPDSPPRFTIRMRRNAENSASDNSPAVGTASGGNNQGTGNPSARVVMPGNQPVPPINVPYRLNTNQRDQVHLKFFPGKNGWLGIQLGLEN